ncbi:MAG: beta-galactosidase, partial [uncultured Chloroflexia bacterium]
TAYYYGGPQVQQKVEDHTRGFYHALIEARIPFEMVHDGLLDAAHIDQFKTLILPNIAALSDTQCHQLRAFVERGGSLVATFETSHYDEWGQPRPSLGLADLFGVDVTGPVEGPMRNSYLHIDPNPDGSFHPLVAGLEDAGRIINGVFCLPVQPRTPISASPLTLIPSYPDLPMEEVYPRVERTDIPEVYLREVGQGRVLYFPWDLDRTFWEVLSVDHGRLLGNAVRWATNEEPVVTVTGPGVLDVTVWQQAQSQTVHLVNLTNPMMMKGPIRELLPVGEQVVRLRLPEGKQARRVHLLRADSTPTVVEEQGYITVTVPSILDIEVIAIDWPSRVTIN